MHNSRSADVEERFMEGAQVRNLKATILVAGVAHKQMNLYEYDAVISGHLVYCMRDAWVGFDPYNLLNNVIVSSMPLRDLGVSQLFLALGL
jgi:hypothetical protein